MTQYADALLFNGRIHTLSSQAGPVEAIAIRHGAVVGNGTRADLEGLVNASTQLEDLAGRAVLPGFVDAHLHWSGTAKALFAVKLDDVRTRDEAVARVAARVRTASAGEWIEGYGWSHAEWQGDTRFPTAADLDGISPDNPVALRARSGHALWANSAAMRLAGITSENSDPVGSEIMRGADGQPTGILLEWAAMTLVTRCIPVQTTDALIAKMRAAQQHALSLGLTGFHDYDWRDSFVALQLMRAAGELDLRVLKQINLEYLDSMLDLGLRPGFGDDWLRIGSVKLFADGALGPRTASMIEPYESEPGNRGIVVIDREQCTKAISRATAAGVPSTVHAIGDRAVRDVLDAFAAARAQEAASGISPRERRHRIEHVQLIHPDDIDRLAELSLIASMQPIHTTSDMDFAVRYWGDRCAYAYNARAQIDRGVTVAFGSDSPIDDLNPIAGIHAAVTRRRADGAPGPDGWYPEARLTVAEAARAYTFGPAYAAHLEARSGGLFPGAFADLVVLDRDLFSIPADELRETRVLGTMVGGEWKYRQF